MGDENIDMGYVRRVAIETTVFQGVASLAIPSLIIHQAVHFAKHRVRKTKGFMRKWGPSIVGLSLIPLMPYIDEPCEHANEWAFNKFFGPPPDRHLVRLHAAHGHGDGHSDDHSHEEKKNS